MKRKPIPTYAFVVDGKTEMWYLQMLKRNERRVNIAIKPELAQKKSLEAQFAQVCTLSESYETVFWIVDLDVFVKEQQEGNTEKIQQLAACLRKMPANAHFIPNMPCLEYWFLLHLKQTSRLYRDYKSLESELHKTEVLRGYEKTERYFIQTNDIYKRLKPYLKEAIKNAQKLPSFDITNLEKGISRMFEIFITLGI